MKAKRIHVMYQINGVTKMASHSDKTVFTAVKQMTSALNSINRDGESTPRARITRVEVEY